VSLPGFPDSFNPGWWRVVTNTPPIFVGTGILAANSAAVTGFAATHQMQPITPLAGQQVSGPGIPSGTAVLASPAPTATGFTMSQASLQSLAGAKLTVGAEPSTQAQAVQWARVLDPSDFGLVMEIVAAARELIEGPEIKRAIMLQQKTLYFMAFPWTGYYSLAIRGMGLNPWWFPYMQGVIQLPYPMLQSIVSVQYIDTNGQTQTLDPSQYIATPGATPGRIQPAWGSIWPVARPQIDAVSITYNCGYGSLESDVPASTRIGLRSLVASAYENREAFLEGGILAAAPMAEKFLQAENWGTYL
jgi:hypothetical protein